MQKRSRTLHQVRELGAYNKGLPGGMETTKGEGREREGSRGGEVRRIRKRIKLSTAAHRMARASESDFELVQISIDQSKPLLTVQILPKAQAESFNSLIDSGATANFINQKSLRNSTFPKYP
jgi:hypothetical protein